MTEREKPLEALVKERADARARGNELFRQRDHGHGSRDTALSPQGPAHLRTGGEYPHISWWHSQILDIWSACFKNVSKYDFRVKIWPLYMSPYGHLEEILTEDKQL